MGAIKRVLGSGLLKGGGAAAPTYASKIAGYSPFWLLKQIETSGTNAADSSGNLFDGTYNGPVLNNVSQAGASMGNAPYYDGVADNITISGAVATAMDVPFNALEGTMICWAKGDSISATRNVMNMGTDDGNRMGFFVTSSIAVTFIISRAGVIRLNFSIASLTTNNWNCYGLTWSQSGNFDRAYANGVRLTTQAYAGIYAGALSTTHTRIGSFNASLYMKGWLGWAMAFSSGLNDAQMLDIATAI